MFIKFAENKCQYHKGQLTPFFIALIVILVVATLVTVNIGKVSLTKTYTANACDAGALAGATAMANIYNSLAEAKETMIDSWNNFYNSMLNNLAMLWAGIRAVELMLESAEEQAYIAMASIAASLVAAYSCLSDQCTECDRKLILLYAAGTAGATYALRLAITNLASAEEMVPNIKEGFQDVLNDGLIEWHDTMEAYFTDLRDSVEDGRESAIEIAYKLAFYNSGISSKLAEEGEGNNNKDVFSDWLEDPDEDSDEDPAYISGNYSWQDGQERNHSVNVAVTINEIPTYNWVVTALSYSALTTLFNTAMALCDELKKNIGKAYNDYMNALYGLLASMVGGIMSCSFMCNCCYNCKSWIDCIICCAIFFIGIILYIYGLLAAEALLIYAVEVYIEDALANVQAIYDTIDAIANGLTPSRTVANPGSNEVLCWLSSVPHDHLVTVKSNQMHEGRSYSLWDVTYPTVRSSATARFGGATSSLSSLDYNANLISVE